MDWNLGDVFDFQGDNRAPDTIAIEQGERTLDWGELTKWSNNLATYLLERGLQPGAKVAVYGRNSIEYVVALIATYKARLVYVNVNFRYRDEELSYLLDYTDTEALIFDREFSEEVDRLRIRLGKVRSFIEIGPRDEPTVLGNADAFHAIVESGDGAKLEGPRSPDDLTFICTGGTTGMPKAVMWRQHDTFLIAARRETLGLGPPESWAELRDAMFDLSHATSFICAPLMHGTGMYIALTGLMFGARILLPSSHQFDPVAVIRTTMEKQVTHLPLIGDAFGKPVADALEEDSELDLRSVEFIISSAAPMSLDVKVSLLSRASKEAVLVDAIGASETASFGVSRLSRAKLDQPPVIVMGRDVEVFTEDLERLHPGDSRPGFVACGGPVPLGYYKDPAKSEQAFKEIDGKRYSIPGDWCKINADGTLNFLGRGNVCINSGGEKIYPQEVEQALLQSDDIYDAVVVGVADPRWGQAVTAILQMAKGKTLNSAQIRSSLKTKLAGYKIPRHFIAIDDIGRGPNGKADYRQLANFAKDRVGRTGSD